VNGPKAELKTNKGVYRHGPPPTPPPPHKKTVNQKDTARLKTRPLIVSLVNNKEGHQIERRGRVWELTVEKILLNKGERNCRALGRGNGSDLFRAKEKGLSLLRKCP